MASSGTATFTVTRDGMIEASLRTLRVLQSGQTPETTDVNLAAESLNMILKNWQVQGLILTCYQQIEIPCVANQLSYTLGESGADVQIPRPLRMLNGSFIRKTISGVVTDTTLENINRQKYEQVRTKAVSGETAMVYYEPSIYIAPSGALFPTSPSTGWGILYLFYPAVDNTFTIWGNFQRPVYDMTIAGEEFDLPQEWFLALKFGLASVLADEYEVPETRCARLMQMANLYRDQLEQWQNAQNDVNFAIRREQQELVQTKEKPRL